VRQKRKPKVVADTKWKRLDAREPNLGVSGPDIYQVLAYAHRFQTGYAVLVYPHHPAVGRAGIQKEFVTQAEGTDQVRVRVVTIDLAKIENVQMQLEQGLAFT
jgi:5-methylcytosine-specific restriction enzyme subunit McrC